MSSIPAHNLNTFSISLSVFFERIGYYGFKAILVLFLFDSQIGLGMDAQQVLAVYAYFTTFLTFAAVAGGLLGDFLLDHRKSLILGGVFQAAGALFISVLPEMGLYPGLFLLVVGSGLYKPNAQARFAKFYQNRPDALDSGFTIFYSVINFAALIGSLLIGFLGTKIGFGGAFLVSSLFFLGGGLFQLISPNEYPEPLFGMEDLRKMERVSSICLCCSLSAVLFGASLSTSIRGSNY